MNKFEVPNARSACVAVSRIQAAWQMFETAHYEVAEELNNTLIPLLASVRSGGLAKANLPVRLESAISTKPGLSDLYEAMNTLRVSFTALYKFPLRWLQVTKSLPPDLTDIEHGMFTVEGKQVYARHSGRLLDAHIGPSSLFLDMGVRIGTVAIDTSTDPVSFDDLRWTPFQDMYGIEVEPV